MLLCMPQYRRMCSLTSCVLFCNTMLANPIPCTILYLVCYRENQLDVLSIVTHCSHIISVIQHDLVGFDKITFAPIILMCLVNAMHVRMEMNK